MILSIFYQNNTLKAEFLNPKNQQKINELLVKNVEGFMPSPFFDGAHSSSLPMAGLENILLWGLPILANKAGVITISTVIYAQSDENHQPIYALLCQLYPDATHTFADKG